MSAGFREAGIWPLSLNQMCRRLDRYKSGGIPKGVILPDWDDVTTEEQSQIRTEVLVLPTDPRPPKKLPRVEVAGRVLTMDLIRQLVAQKKDAAKHRVTKPSANKVPSKLASKRPRSTRIQRRTQLTIALDDVDLSTQDSGSDGEDHDDAVPFLSLLGGQDVDIAAQSGMERAPCDDVVEMVEL
ncbi:hypothetical protein AaE_002888 [Aphanomyces astaci]|uniref:Uncharacterized protein n=1 Tax=Aphanomyces astaci TaxID=112090 RepID=A0A6A5AEH7_APHAT|nr:hypothetical protein AaE_002888 [Aphanomyces astaci]